MFFEYENWFGEKELSYVPFWQGLYILLFNGDKTVKFVPWWKVKTKEE